jgi:hypothetical protein
MAHIASPGPWKVSDDGRYLEDADGHVMFKIPAFMPEADADLIESAWELLHEAAWLIRLVDCADEHIGCQWLGHEESLRLVSLRELVEALLAVRGEATDAS